MIAGSQASDAGAESGITTASGKVAASGRGGCASGRHEPTSSIGIDGPQSSASTTEPLSYSPQATNTTHIIIASFIAPL